MNETMIALLTGLLGTGLGTVLIGGALVAAWLLGRERGRREGRENATDEPGSSQEEIRRLHAAYTALRREFDQLAEDQRFTIRLLQESVIAPRHPSIRPGGDSPPRGSPSAA